MSDNNRTLFRVHFRVETAQNAPLQPKTYDVAAETPREADNTVRRSHAGKRVYIDKIKVIKEDD